MVSRPSRESIFSDFEVPLSDWSKFRPFRLSFRTGVFQISYTYSPFNPSPAIMFWRTEETQTKASIASSNGDLRRFEAAEIVSEIVEPDEDDPTAVHLSSFNWDSGSYHHPKVWIVVTIQAIVSCIVTIVCLVVSNGMSKSAYSLWGPRPTTPKTEIEVIRLVLQIFAPFLAYSILQLVIIGIPSAAGLVARALGKLKPGPVHRLRIDSLLKLRRRIGALIYGICASIIAHDLFPEVQAASQTPTEEVANPVLQFTTNILSYFRGNNLDFFMNRFFLSFSAVALLVLVEKSFVVWVTINFHRHGVERRQNKNRFIRKVNASLVKLFNGQELVHSGKSSIGEVIFDGIGKQSLREEDFCEYMDSDEASEYFEQLDEDSSGHGTLNRNEFIQAVEKIRREEQGIHQALINSSKLLDKFDTLMMIVTALVATLFILVIFEPPVTIIFSYILSIIASMVFLFGSTTKDIFDSIIFVIFTHPFDRDDWLLLSDGILYQVREIGLLTSSFLTPQNDLVYMTNLSLNGQPIINLKRSEGMSELIDFRIMPDTPRDKLAKLEENLVSWVKEYPQHFLDKMYLRDFLVTDQQHMKVQVRLWHKANFDDMTKKDHRTRLFMLQLRDALQQIGIKMSPPVLPI